MDDKGRNEGYSGQCNSNSQQIVDHQQSNFKEINAEIQEQIVQVQKKIKPSNQSQHSSEVKNQLQIQSQYFYIDSTDPNHPFVKGACHKMISETENDFNYRDIDAFQQYPFEPISKYFRNKSYDKPEQIRTPDALDKSLQYLKQNFLATVLKDQKKIAKIILGKSKKKKQQAQSEQIQKTKQRRLTRILQLIEKESYIDDLHQENIGFLLKHDYKRSISKEEQRKIQNLQERQNIKLKQMGVDNQKSYFRIQQKLLVFVESRLHAIRCEMFAQGLIFPRLVMELLKCEIFLYTLKQQEYNQIGSQLKRSQEIGLVGLDTLLDLNIKDKLLEKQDFRQYYLEALSIAILRTKIQNITKLISQHQSILQTPHLRSILRVRLQMQRGNYHKYFMMLSHQDSVLIICLMLTHLSEMQERLCNVLKSARMDVKKGWLAFLLGLKVKPEEQNDIINLYKNPEYVNDKIKMKQVKSKQHVQKNWLQIEELFDQLIIKSDRKAAFIQID